MGDSIKSTEWDARQDFTRDTNKRFTLLCELDSYQEWEQLFSRTNTLYKSLRHFFNKEQQTRFEAARNAYYTLLQDYLQQKARGIHKNPRTKLHIYIPTVIKLRQESDKLFTSLSDMIHENKLLLPYANINYGEDLDFESALSSMGL